MRPVQSKMECIERVHFILLGSCMSTIPKMGRRSEKRVWCVSIGCFGYALRNFASLLLVLFWSSFCTLSIGYDEGKMLFCLMTDHATAFQTR